MRNNEEFDQLRLLLEEIRNNQKTQLERQSESLSIQKEQFRVFLEQQEKTQKIQDRAEAIQDKSAQIVNRARRLFPLVLAAIVALLGYVTWLLWRIHR
jgi:cytochrome c-type biogenesis protein CcmH/NrfG